MGGDAASGSLSTSTKLALIRTREVVTTWVLRAWVKGLSRGLFHHTQKMAHKQEVVSQEFIRRNIISSPEIGTPNALTAPKPCCGLHHLTM